MEIEQKLVGLLGKSIAEATDREVYDALLTMVSGMIADRKKNEGKKRLYYISAEFLIGKLLSNNLINLGIYEQVQQLCERNGKSLGALEEIEVEPSLGNGGLGRLAACFLDSVATLGLPGDGIGLNYHLGLFRQKLEDREQKELPNPWMEKPGWLIPTDIHYEMEIAGHHLTSRMYDIAVTGYEGGLSTLHLFDLDSVEDSLVQDGITFDKTRIEKNLTLFLYPDDSDEEGRMLRVCQEYFMVSNGAQLILNECKQRGSNLHDLADYAVIQINDTHPSMVIPELIRLLLQEGIQMDEAISIVSHCCAYTNHTILAEALETWPMAYFKKVVPALIPIIEVLDDKVRRNYQEEVSIIDRNGLVHMAYMAIHYGFSVNGVAALHTEILKNQELNVFYRIYPDKFNNKTNGITFRRWLLECDPRLSHWLDRTIGTKYRRDASALADLLQHRREEQILQELVAIKQENKEQLAAYLERTQGIRIDPTSVFDIQSKRLHEYKRQQMNALYVIHEYQQIKKGLLPAHPITVIFAAKAAPAYVIAKDIIHMILCLQEIVNQDPQVSPWLRVIMVENYNVTMAEKLIPACDLSEQISLASKEASGTGNMKFMLNGAVTIGTEDGANVEIHERVGDDNIYIFGKSSDEVIRHYANQDYHSGSYYDQSETIRDAVDFITGPQMMAVGNAQQLNRLQQELLHKDWFMTLLDLEDYIQTKERAVQDYTDRRAWAEKMLVNIAEAGFFSADRTIGEYNAEIWKLR